MNHPALRDQLGYDVLGNCKNTSGNGSQKENFCYAPDGTQQDRKNPREHRNTR
jgi:hypothetical protein